MKYELKRISLRMVHEDSLYHTVPINEPVEAVSMLRERLADYNREVFVVICVDAKGHPLNYFEVGSGSVSQSPCSLGELFKAALLCNAQGVLAVHNHPSGCVVPSDSDYAVTKKIAEGCSIFELKFYDHIICGPGKEYFSFCVNGLGNILNGG